MRPDPTVLWGNQQRFRQGLQSSAARLFEAAGEPMDPRAVLVGLGEGGAVLVDAADPALEASVTASLAAAPLPPDDADATRLTVRSATERASSAQETVVLVGAGGRVADTWLVLPVLCFARDRWTSKPALRRGTSERHLVTSFQEALADQLLDAASHALRSQRTPVDFGAHVDPALIDETIRRAAARLTDGIVARVGHEGRSGLHRAMDAVAAQPYEGRAGLGRVVLARADHPGVDMRIRFVDPIPVSSTRRFRKALEVTNDVLSLVCDGTHLRGLGVVRGGSSSGVSDGHGESIFALDVLGRGEWQVAHDATPLLRVANTQPVFPQLPLSVDAFHRAVTHTFPGVSHREARVLWDLTETASRTEGGTILVFHPRAEEEARRLAAQAQLVEAEVLGPRAVEAITAIDGAVLLDPFGRCHAIGVILDGVASDAGEPGRGARFNSAIRYHEGHGAQALVVVISEDGMIDLVPTVDQATGPGAF